MTTRLDVFSIKGGVGKTCIAFLLAKLQSEEKNEPVLLIDADLTGTCLGDLIQPAVDEPWSSRKNLNHLVCTTSPERLDESLREEPLVYVHNASGTMQPLPGPVTGGKLLFCPSHLYATSKARGAPGASGMSHEFEYIPAEVLHALLGHESAGGWVQHVLDELIKATVQKVGKLGAVIVDHGPGIGALQSALLETVKGKEDKAHPRRALVVTSRDWVDLAATATLEAMHLKPRSDSGNQPPEQLRGRVTWVVNQVRRSEGDWRESVKKGLTRNTAATLSRWFTEDALPLYEDDQLAEAYSRSGLSDLKTNQELTSLRNKIFGS